MVISLSDDPIRGGESVCALYNTLNTTGRGRCRRISIQGCWPPLRCLCFHLFNAVLTPGIETRFGTEGSKGSGGENQCKQKLRDRTQSEDIADAFDGASIRDIAHVADSWIEGIGSPRRTNSSESLGFSTPIGLGSLCRASGVSLADGNSLRQRPSCQNISRPDTLVGSEFPSIQACRPANSSSSILDNPSPRRIKAPSLPATRCWGSISRLHNSLCERSRISH